MIDDAAAPSARAGGRATLAKRRADVATMFDRVAARYDLANDVLSLGQDRSWRRAVREAVDPRPGERVLDLAAGTGHVQRAVRPRRGDRRPHRPLARACSGSASSAEPGWRSWRATRCGCRSPTAPSTP